MTCDLIFDNLIVSDFMGLLLIADVYRKREARIKAFSLIA